MIESQSRYQNFRGIGCSFNGIDCRGLAKVRPSDLIL